MTSPVTSFESIGDFGEFWRRVRPDRPFSVVHEIRRKRFSAFSLTEVKNVPVSTQFPRKYSRAGLLEKTFGRTVHDVFLPEIADR